MPRISGGYWKRNKVLSGIAGFNFRTPETGLGWSKKMYRSNFSVRVPEGVEETDGYVVLKHGQEFSIMLRNDTEDRCDAEVEVEGKYIGTFRVDPKKGITLTRPADDTGKFVFFKKGSKEFNKVHGGDVSFDTQGLVTVTFRPEKKVAKTCRRINDPIHCYHNQMYAVNTPNILRGRTMGEDSLMEPLSFNSVSMPDSSSSEWAIASMDSGTVTTWTSSTSYSPTLTTNWGTRGTQANQGTCGTQGTQKRSRYAAGGVGLQGESHQQYEVVPNLVYDESESFTMHLRLVAKAEERQDPRPLRPSGHRSTPIPPPVWMLW